MWDKLTRKVIFLYLYNILFWDSSYFNQENTVISQNSESLSKSKKSDKVETTISTHFDNTSNLKLNSLANLEKLSQIYELDEDLKKISQESILEKLDLFQNHQPEFEVALQNSLSNWKQTYSIVKAILFTFLTEFESITSSSVLEIEKNNLVSDGSKISALEKDVNLNIIGKYLRLAQDYGNSQSVSVIHAVLAKILKSENS